VGADQAHRQLLGNLKRAKDKRKKESIEALRKVVIAARKTSVYMRQVQETGNRSHDTEAELAVLWTELSFALQDLGVDKLAKRCYIKGKQWADRANLIKTIWIKRMLAWRKWSS